MVNAAAGTIVGGKAEDFGHALELAETSIKDGSAYKKLKGLIKFSGGDVSKLEELELRYG